MIVYVDKDYKCHASNDGTMIAVEIDDFNDKCQTYIEGYCYDDSKGYAHVYPWKPMSELEAAQEQYEKDSAALLAAYQEGVNSAYD